MNLTPRQQEVAALVAKRMTRSEIASELGISQETVKTHVRQAAGRIGGSEAPRRRLAIWFFRIDQREGDP